MLENARVDWFQACKDMALSHPGTDPFPWNLETILYSDINFNSSKYPTEIEVNENQARPNPILFSLFGYVFISIM